MTEPEDMEDEELELPEEEPEPPTDEELDALKVAAEDAEDDDSDLSDREAAKAKRDRLAPLRDRLGAYLYLHPGWQRWPEVVAGVEGRPLAELSPRNGRIRQAALAMSKEGLVDIRYGQKTVFEAARRSGGE